MRDVGAKIFDPRSAAQTFFPRFSIACLAAVMLVMAVGGCQEKTEKTPADLVADGWRFFREGDYLHSDMAFQQANLLASGDAALRQQALYGLAMVWNLRRPDFDRDRAAKYLQEAFDLSPKTDTAAWIMLAQARMIHTVLPGDDPALDDIKKSHPDYAPIREAYQKVIATFPDHPAGFEAFVYLETTYVATLDPAESRQAIAALSAFMAKYPKTGFECTLYMLLGQAHFTLGEYPEHLQATLRSLETRPIDPTNPIVDYAQPYYELACVAEFEVGDFATARKYYQKLIDEYPVDQRGAACRTALKRMDAVEAMARAGTLKADDGEGRGIPIPPEGTADRAPKKSSLPVLPESSGSEASGGGGS
jgi:tetratricopeptide (TPR) repeat protein